MLIMSLSHYICPNLGNISKTERIVISHWKWDALRHSGVLNSTKIKAIHNTKDIFLFTVIIIIYQFIKFSSNQWQGESITETVKRLEMDVHQKWWLFYVLKDISFATRTWTLAEPAVSAVFHWPSNCKSMRNALSSSDGKLSWISRRMTLIKPVQKKKKKSLSLFVTLFVPTSVTIINISNPK